MPCCRAISRQSRLASALASISVVKLMTLAGFPLSRTRMRNRFPCVYGPSILGMSLSLSVVDTPPGTSSTMELS